MKKFIAGVLIGIFSMSSTYVFASNATKTAQISYQNIRVVVDGVPVSINQEQEPFIYNGTTYLPVRAIGDAFGKNVSWDGGSKTVYIGENPNQKNYLMTVCPPYDTDYGYYTANKETIDGTNTFKMAGKTYSRGFKVGFCTEDTGTNVLFNLNGLYSTMEFDLGPVDEHLGFPLQLKIYLDGNLSEIIEMDSDELPKHMSVSLNNAQQLKIIAVSADGNGMWGTQFGLANIEVR